jgi:hypothetical protein
MFSCPEKMVILMSTKVFTASEFVPSAVYCPGILFDLCSFVEMITMICQLSLFCLGVTSQVPIRFSVLQTLIDTIREIMHEQRAQSCYIYVYFHIIINTNMAVVGTFKLRTTQPPFNLGQKFFRERRKNF